MKYLISLLLGIVTGVVLFAATLYYNPFADKQRVSPLAVSSQQLLNLSYSAVPSEAVLFTNDGESTSAPYPEKTNELWEAPVRNTRVIVVQLSDSLGEPNGIGVKFSSDSETTRLLNAEALVDSVWHIYMPERGSLFVSQRENYWSYLRDIVFSARSSSADAWRGAWSRVTTVGPNAIGTARVVGGNGEFANLESEAIESLNATAYSAETGPVAMSGSITIALPDEATASQTAQQF